MPRCHPRAVRSVARRRGTGLAWVHETIIRQCLSGCNVQTIAHGRASGLLLMGTRFARGAWTPVG